MYTCPCSMANRVPFLPMPTWKNENLVESSMVTPVVTLCPHNSHSIRDGSAYVAVLLELYRPTQCVCPALSILDASDVHGLLGSLNCRPFFYSRCGWLLKWGERKHRRISPGLKEETEIPEATEKGYVGSGQLNGKLNGVLWQCHGTVFRNCERMTYRQWAGKGFVC